MPDQRGGLLVVYLRELLKGRRFGNSPQQIQEGTAEENESPNSGFRRHYCELPPSCQITFC